MNSFSQFPFLLGEGIRQFMRFRINSLAVLLSAAVAMFLLAGVISGFSILDRLLDGLREDLIVAVYLEDGANQEQMDKMLADLRSRPGVREVRLRDKAEALRAFREQLGTEVDELFAFLEGNPLPSSLVIHCDEAAAAKALVKHIRSGYPLFISEVHYGGMVFERMSALVHVLRVIIMSLLVVLLLAMIALVTTSVAVNLQTRREEIEIMQLVGATRNFIALPHMIESIILVVLAMVAAVFGIYAVKGFALDALAGHLPVARGFLQGIPSVRSLLMVGLIGFTVLSGSTWIALRRYLRT